MLEHTDFIYWRPFEKQENCIISIRIAEYSCRLFRNVRSKAPIVALNLTKLRPNISPASPKASLPIHYKVVLLVLLPVFGVLKVDVPVPLGF